jgi:hypothetical protein
MIWINNLKSGLVLYASSDNPIINANELPRNNPINEMFEKTFGSGSRIMNRTVEKINPRNKLIPPRDGLDWLLHRIITSFLFRIPRVCENRNNNILTIQEIINDPMKKSR